MPTRQLYTTNDSVLIDIKSRLIITAINKEIFESGTGDLAERTISIEIDRPEGKYITEETLNEDFDLVRADVLGGVLALVQGYLKNGIPKKGETSEFRMTTYASVGKYVTKALGLGQFSQAYKVNQLGMSRNSLDAEPITDFIVWYTRKHGGECIRCTPLEGWGVDKNQLFEEFFNEWLREKQEFLGNKKFPKSASKLLAKLKRIAPDLKKIYGIEIKNTGVHKGKEWIMIKSTAEAQEGLADISENDMVVRDKDTPSDALRGVSQSKMDGW
jgi:hypothetical protein